MTDSVDTTKTIEIYLEEYIHDQQINIEKKKLKEWKSKVRGIYNLIGKEVATLVKDGTITFPFKNTFTSKDDILSSFEQLCKYKPNIIHSKFHVVNLELSNEDNLKFKNQHTILLRNRDDYDQFGSLIDYFQEKIRLECYRFDRISTLKYWEKKTSFVIERCLQQHNELNPKYLRETLFSLHYEVGTFRLSVGHSLINMFKGTHILDPCAGWGCRMISALSCKDVKLYCGVDPNSALFKGYKSMLNIFNRKPIRSEPMLVHMIESTFEDAVLDDICTDEDGPLIDLVITSPPYFTLETYVGGDMNKQSNIMYPDLKEWNEKFLHPMLKKAWLYLKDKGHMIIIINDSIEHKFVNTMLNYVKTFSDSDYLGCIAYAEDQSTENVKQFSNRPQPAWIWQKNT